MKRAFPYRREAMLAPSLIGLPAGLALYPPLSWERRKNRSRRSRGKPQRFGRRIVPVQFFAPQRQAQIFFSRGVWRSARVMP